MTVIELTPYQYNTMLQISGAKIDVGLNSPDAPNALHDAIDHLRYAKLIDLRYEINNWHWRLTSTGRAALKAHLATIEKAA